MFLWKLKEYASIPFLMLKKAIQNTRGYENIIEEKIQYGEDVQQHIIFAMPKTGVTKRNIIFFAHGGGWSNGSAFGYRCVGHFFASHGFATIVAGYRLSPEFKFPTQVDDIVKSLETGINTANKYFNFTGNVIAIGQSAGAHLVTLLAYSGLLDYYEFGKDIFSGVISISGSLNFSLCKARYIRRKILDFIGHVRNFDKADPYKYASCQTSFPLLCIHGANDPIVELENSATFVKKATESGNLAELLTIEGELHSNLNKILTGEHRETSYMLEWIERLEEKTGTVLESNKMSL